MARRGRNVTMHGAPVTSPRALRPAYFAGEAAAGVVVLAPWDDPPVDPPSDDELDEPAEPLEPLEPLELASPDDGAAPAAAPEAVESEEPPADAPADDPVRASFL